MAPSILTNNDQLILCKENPAILLHVEKYFELESFLLISYK